MNPYLEIIRPGNAILAVIAVLLMAIISGVFTMEVLIACIVVFVITGFGNAVNDYFDHKIDAINRPERPIPSGRISLKAAGYYSLALALLSNIMAILFLGLVPGLIVLVSTLLMFYYAHTLKKKLLIGNLLISFLTGLSFVFGGVVVGVTIGSIYIGFYAFLTNMMREIVKDMEDVKGDKIEGANTLPIAYGMKSSSILAASFMIFASLTSPILYFLGILTIWFLPVLLIAILIFLSSAVSILRDSSIENAQKISGRVKIGMMVTLIGFGVGSPFLLSLF
ncbi:MAG TPA: UbiA family prenyltransferase [Methanobacterium sp.]|jgi:geranylgeranylglycerol-phosphate geranylgeranyltransferase|nr:MAG: geranylgeranylglycerol-phosphate geranylgeranyltransferase [Methanobacterium sp.]HOI72383.1 UbiA family prenyltransferase [Methanobacterium sp.]